MLKSSSLNFIDPCIFMKAIMTVPNISAAVAASNYANRKIIFKNWALFTYCISEINNIQINR